MTTTLQPFIGGQQTPPTLDVHGETTSAPALARALWGRRELLVLLARKEFHVRYRRASFGTLWAVALPLIQSGVMAVVFSHVVRFAVPHYAVFMLSGMVAWTYFAAAFGGGATAIVDNSDLSSRVYFPRAVLTLVAAATNLYGLVITLAIVLLLCPLLGVGLGLHLLLLVPAVVLLVAFATGLTLSASALHVYFRDVRYIVAASLVLLMYVSPVIYPPTLAPHVLRVVLDVNPLTGILDLFHASMVSAGGPLVLGVAVSAAWTVVLLALAVALHCRYDRVFSDLL